MLTAIRTYLTGLYFHPDSKDYGSPALYEVIHEEVSFRAQKGHRLHGYFLKPGIDPRGTIVHCHGNTKNISHHFQNVLFLVRSGYQVFCFDYSGYGKSEGISSLDTIVSDTMAALVAVRQRAHVDPFRIGLFGQSLGGAAASGAMAQDPAVRCLLLEGTFTTFREVAWTTPVGKGLFFLTFFLIPDTGPLRDLPSIAPRPVMILHGADDHKIPMSYAYRLYEKASHKKSLSIIKGLHHLHAEEVPREYERSVCDFFEKNLAG